MELLITVNPASLHELSIRAGGVRSDSIIKKRDKNKSTETSPLGVIVETRYSCPRLDVEKYQSIANENLSHCQITAELSACLRAQQRGLRDGRANSIRRVM